MKKIIAITSCPVGIAHTYMAAENLEKAGKAVGAEVKVETHGSIGIENELTAKDIEEAAGVIIAADTKIDKSRFGGKPLITVGVQEGIHHADELVGEILAGKAPIYKSTETTISAETKSESENLGKKIYKSLMNGVSYMVPFVVTGGLLIAISLTLGGTATPEGIKIPEGTIWATMNSIGSIAMGLMVPILSAFIAQSIADRPGLVPGFVGGMLAANGALYGSDANAGFLGGIITGFLAGFIALGIKKVRVPKALQSIMPIIVIPILGSLAVGFVFIYVIGEPVALLFSSLTHFLAGMQGGSEIVLAMILGAMIAFDMGGPFNKVAFLFGSGLIAEGNYSIMGPIAVAICIPPLALGLASLILKTKFTKTEREAGKASLAMGLVRDHRRCDSVCFNRSITSDSKYCSRSDDRKCHRNAFRSDRSCRSWRSNRSSFRSSRSCSHVFCSSDCRYCCHRVNVKNLETNITTYCSCCSKWGSGFNRI